MYPSNDHAATLRLAQYRIDERVADVAARRSARATLADGAATRERAPIRPRRLRIRLPRVAVPRFGH